MHQHYVVEYCSLYGLFIQPISCYDLCCRFLPVYVAEMESLRTSDSESYEILTTPGQWTVTRKDTKFTSTAPDQVIEQTVNRQSKLSGGVQGVTLNPGTHLFQQA